MAEETEVVSIDTLPMAEYKKARNDGVTTIPKAPEKPAEDEQDKDEQITASAEEPKGEEKPDERPKTKTKFEKRIDRLIKHNATLEEQLQAAQDRASALEAKLGGKQEEPKDEADPEPKVDGFKTYEEYVKAQARWEARQELKAQAEADAKRDAAEQYKETVDTYNKKVAEAQAKYDDWKEVVGQDLQIPPSVGQAIFFEMENGPDVAYYIGKHPEIVEKILEMTPLRAAAEAWKISEKLAETAKPNETEKADEKEEKVAAKPTTKAPAPISPVGGSNTRSHVPLDQMPMNEYKKARSAGRIN